MKSKIKNKIELKPIQTEYKGYLFRSRLEARWAVFFDSLGIEWEYEKEGFELSNGMRYLPDFYFPHTKTWGEVKPDNFTEEENLKATLFVENIKQPLIKLVGVPNIGDYKVLSLFESDTVIEMGVCLSLEHKQYDGDKRFFVMCDDNHEDINLAIRRAKSARFEFDR